MPLNCHQSGKAPGEALKTQLGSCVSISGDTVAEPIDQTPQQKHTNPSSACLCVDELAALPAQLSSLCKKPDDLGERGAILPEKSMAAFEHAQGRPWDSSSHVFL